jgi:hypothetical protein
MSNKVCALRFGISGALTLFILFALCWLGAIIWPVGPSHMFIALFTAAPVDSFQALLVGGCAAIFIGAVSGVLLAWTFNLTASLHLTRT